MFLQRGRATKSGMVLLGLCLLLTHAVGQNTQTSEKGGKKNKKQNSSGQTTSPTTVLPSAPAHDFLTIRATELWLGKYQFNNIGVNMPDLFTRFLNGDDIHATEAMRDAHTLGVRFIRCDGNVRSPETFRIFVTERTRWLNAFTRMLSAADTLGIELVPTLLPDIHLIPGYLKQQGSSEGGLPGYLTPGNAANTLALDYVNAIVTRYRNDPRVLFWEIGDEYNREADLPVQTGGRSATDFVTSDQIRAFLIQIALRIKQIDKKHPLSSGNGDMRPNSWHLRQAMLSHRADLPPGSYPLDDTRDTFDQYTQMMDFFTPAPIDIVSVHQSPPGSETVRWLVEDDTHAFRLPWTRQAAESLSVDPKNGKTLAKPLFIGAFGQEFWRNGKLLNVDWTTDYLRRLRAGEATIAALRNWETGEQEPDGGPYSLSLKRAPDLLKTLSTDNIALQAEALTAPYIR